jgi:hypothetical protein
MFFLPEKNDEVLVAFEQGDSTRPAMPGRDSLPLPADGAARPDSAIVDPRKQAPPKP